MQSTALYSALLACWARAEQARIFTLMVTMLSPLPPRLPDKAELRQCSQGINLQDLLRHRHHTLFTQDLAAMPLKT